MEEKIVSGIVDYVESSSYQLSKLIAKSPGQQRWKTKNTASRTQIFWTRQGLWEEWPQELERGWTTVKNCPFAKFSQPNDEKFCLLTRFAFQVSCTSRKMFWSQKPQLRKATCDWLFFFFLRRDRPIMHVDTARTKDACAVQFSAVDSYAIIEHPEGIVSVLVKAEGRRAFRIGGT